MIKDPFEEWKKFLNETKVVNPNSYPQQLEIIDTIDLEMKRGK